MTADHVRPDTDPREQVVDRQPGNPKRWLRHPRVGQRVVLARLLVCVECCRWEHRGGVAWPVDEQLAQTRERDK